MNVGEDHLGGIRVVHVEHFFSLLYVGSYPLYFAFEKRELLVKPAGGGYVVGVIIVEFFEAGSGGGGGRFGLLGGGKSGN